MKVTHRTIFQNLTLTLFSIILCFFVAEIVVRLNPSLYTLGYKRSFNEKLVYELYPNYTFKKHQGKISSQGLNDRYYPYIKPEGFTRIAFVGDSYTFGWNLGQDNSFPNILENILKENEKKPYEVINFSVPGYNTAQELELIEDKVLKFEPDIVVVVFTGNDLHVPNYLQVKVTSANLLFYKSYFLHFILVKIDNIINDLEQNHIVRKKWLDIKKNALGRYYPQVPLYPYPGLEETIYIHGDPPKVREHVPERYWYMLGLDNYKKHLRRIKDVLAEHRVVFISSGHFFKEIQKIQEDLGIQYTLNFYSKYEQHGLRIEDLWFPNDKHFNLKGNRLVADFFYEFLKDNELL